MAKLHNEIRIKSVDGIGGSDEGAPAKFEAGSIVYDAAGGVYRKKSGAIGTGSWDVLTQEDIRGIRRLEYPHVNTTDLFVVTVATKDASHRYNGTGSSSGYKIDGVFSPLIQLTPGRTYRFTQEEGTNSGHRLRFYQNADKSGGTYATGVTVAGTLGSSGAYTQIVVSDTTPAYLHYQCDAHAHMGNAIVSQTGKDASAAVTNLSATANGTSLTVESSTGNDVALPLADASNWGVMSKELFVKLNGIEGSADVTDATNVNAAGAIMHTDLATKGQIVVGDGTGDATILGVGTNTHVLTADSTEASGVKWAAVAGGSTRTVEVDTNGDGSANETLGGAEALRIKQGEHMDITESGGIVNFKAESQFGHYEKDFTSGHITVHGDIGPKNGGFFVVQGGGTSNFGSYNITCSFSSISKTAGRATPKYEFFNKDTSKKWKFVKTNGTLKDYTQTTTISDGADIEILANQYLSVWYNGSEWRYIVRSV